MCIFVYAMPRPSYCNLYFLYLLHSSDLTFTLRMYVPQGQCLCFSQPYLSGHSTWLAGENWKDKRTKCISLMLCRLWRPHLGVGWVWFWGNRLREVKWWMNMAWALPMGVPGATQTQHDSTQILPTRGHELVCLYSGNLLLASTSTWVSDSQLPCP